MDDLLAVNKCPDFIVNRGHYFGTDYFKEEPGLSDEDKKRLDRLPEDILSACAGRRNRNARLDRCFKSRIRTAGAYRQRRGADAIGLPEPA